MAAKSKGVIYIKRSGFDYYASDRPDILHVEFPPTTVQDMEVVNKEELVKLLQNFITANKVLPSRSIIILSAATFFQKDIVVAKPEELEPQIKTFLNNVPFEHVSFKTFDVEKSKRIVATNKDIYQNIKEFLEKNAFVISLIVAPSSLGKESTFGETLTLDQAKAVIQKMDSIKPTENFLEQQKVGAPTAAEALSVPIPKKRKTVKSSLPLLLSVFGLLIAVLIGVYYMQSQQNSKLVARGEQRATPFPTTPPTDTPTPEPTAPVSSESAALQKKATKIQLLNGSQIPGQAEKERRDLNAIGYSDVKTGNAVSAATTKTLIIFAKKVPDYIRDDIIAHLKKTYQEITSQEIDQAEFDVIITLGGIIAATVTVTP